MKITGIVLCGGRSTRMGRDKASLPFGDETLLERAVRVVKEVADAVIVVVRPDDGGGNPFSRPPKRVARRWRGLPVCLVHDPVANLGPLAGIAAGLSASTTDLNIVIACDMPLIRPAVLQRLVDLRGDADICLAVVDGQASPLCAVYRAGVAGVAQELLASGERRVMALLDRVHTQRVDAAAFRDIDPDLESFLSCNTPEEFEKARTRSAARPESGA